MRVDCQKCVFCGFTGFKQFQAEQPEQRWIPCSERLPEAEGSYLVAFTDGDMRVASKRGVVENHDIEPKMLAWMPLPEPYKEAQE